MKNPVLAGSTSNSIEIFAKDPATGEGKTGLVFNTAGLTCYYMRPNSAPVAITLATLAAINSAWASGGFKEADATNAKGLYRLDVPDAAFAVGADHVLIVPQLAGTIFEPSEIPLTRVPNLTIGTVLTDAGNSASQSKLDFTANIKRCGLRILTGTLAGQFTKVLTHNTGTGIATFETLTGTMAVGDLVMLVDY